VQFRSNLQQIPDKRFISHRLLFEIQKNECIVEPILKSQLSTDHTDLHRY